MEDAQRELKTTRDNASEAKTQAVEIAQDNYSDTYWDWDRVQRYGTDPNNRCITAVGLTTWIDHRPYELSGGQQQRVAIARALAIRPRLILADEPTGDLDSKTGEQILGLLRSLVRHEAVTILMATHDPAAADFATDLYHLRDGTIAERVMQG